MIDDEDQKDVINASVRNLVMEIQKLGAISQIFHDTIAENKEETMLENMLAMLAQNSNVTLALSSVVISHLQGEGLLRDEIKLHS